MGTLGCFIRRIQVVVNRSNVSVAFTLPRDLFVDKISAVLEAKVPSRIDVSRELDIRCGPASSPETEVDVGVGRLRIEMPDALCLPVAIVDRKSGSHTYVLRYFKENWSRRRSEVAEVLQGVLASL